MNGIDSGGKVLGVIGGMGPLATDLFYRMTIEHTAAGRDQDHIDMIILSHASMPDRTEAILSGHGNEVRDRLIADAQLLERSGADYIAIPCNTSHNWIREISAGVGIPVIDMVATAADTAAKKGLRRVGVLATDGTVRMGLYQKACAERGVDAYVPTEAVQALVMKIIYEGIKSAGEIDFNDFKAIERELTENGCEGAIMACTELSCFKSMYNLTDYYIDAMEETVKKAIVACGKKLTAK